jgi:flavin-dependent dehydrogenase
VLDCTGRTGVLARQGWRRPRPGRRTLALIGIWTSTPGWRLDDDTHTLVESYADGWAWSVPLAGGPRCIAVMVDPTLTSLAGRRIGSAYRQELGRTRHFSELVAGATLVGSAWACDASSYAADRVGTAGALLVGDAASFVDPLSSFGVKKALASAWLAAVVTHTCLERPEMQRPALRLYESRELAMFESLSQQSVEFSRLAAGSHAHEFWRERAARDLAESDAETGGDPDVAGLRHDADLLRAFDELKRSPSIRLRPTGTLGRVELPIVRGNLVALAEHLCSPAFPRGIRYVRDVDLVRLVDMASEHAQVPDLFDAYIREAPPVPLPDFLGALSLLIGKGMLENTAV